MAHLPLYQAQIEPGWIDYNGHVRDAYYALMASYASDQVMDDLGLDAAYRQSTHCTLYTLECHLHYLREIKASDAVSLRSAVLAFDRKRIHLACRFEVARIGAEAAATAELMLLHVHQGETVHTAALPDEVLAKLAQLDAGPDIAARFVPGSRQIALQRG